MRYKRKARFHIHSFVSCWVKCKCPPSKGGAYKWVHEDSKVSHSFIHVLLSEMNMALCPEVHELWEHGAMTEVVPRTVSGEVGR